MDIRCHGDEDRTVPERVAERTWRTVGTGTVLGALLTHCNVYSGLKIGWSFNMSIVAGFRGAAGRLGVARPWGLLENNINQTAASSAPSILSAVPEDSAYIPFAYVRAAVL